MFKSNDKYNTTTNKIHTPYRSNKFYQNRRDTMSFTGDHNKNMFAESSDGVINVDRNLLHIFDKSQQILWNHRKIAMGRTMLKRHHIYLCKKVKSQVRFSVQAEKSDNFFNKQYA